jgi:hypothetical protein
LRLRGVKELVQEHIIGRKHNEEGNPGLLASKGLPLSTLVAKLRI